MKRNSLVFILPLLIFAFTVPKLKPTVRGNYPSNYFQAPVAQALLLAGTFGELRPNHFHAGIDIKSARGVAGDAVFSAADGYVSRIKVDKSGYGNSLYISHPNGYTTVYAHLDKYNLELANYVKAQQYIKESFEIDIYPSHDKFPVSQGDEVGKMGNTGSSNGAHLHFEVRETSTQNPLNPLLFGFRVVDNIAPKMHALKVYSLNEKREELGAKAITLVKLGEGYKVKGDTVLLDAGQTGFGLKVYDHFDKVSNWNGIYELSTYQDDSLVYDFSLESFSFDESRYINAHCDYEERVTKNSYYNRCYALPGNHMSIYRHKSNNGVIDLQEGQTSRITMVASDVAGNSSTLEFWVKIKPNASILAQPVLNQKYNYILPFNEGNMIRTEGLYLHMPPGTLYEDLYLKYDVLPERSTGYYSNVHRLSDSRTPVHEFFDIGIRPTQSIPAELKPKVFVAYCEGSRILNCGGRWEDGLLRAKVRGLGSYAIMADVTPPVIKQVVFGQNMKSYQKFSFKISDNVATAPNVEELNFDAHVDGQWVLMEYDKKNGTITHRFDGVITPGEHNFRLVVRDAVGNETVFERKFFR
ncbi:MAG: peptidoglycan DD-metalloendopeptidase family protein [Saprospiraceae bacterium]|nr:peptidoglycan DD-metalloendopeptidase family protein [Saprospiraceae bacterium]